MRRKKIRVSGEKKKLEKRFTGKSARGGVERGRGALARHRA